MKSSQLRYRIGSEAIEVIHFRQRATATIDHGRHRNGQRGQDRHDELHRGEVGSTTDRVLASWDSKIRTEYNHRGEEAGLHNNNTVISCRAYN